jgi:acetolactate synthase-1/2/3 large subunit
MRACDYIAERLYRAGVRRIYGLMGGGAAGLNDGFITHDGLDYVCFHHEQGAGHAAVGEAKLTGRISVVNPTTGCGGTNCITSVLAAWQDSVPVLFISGNVRRDQCSRWINQRDVVSIRKYGIQEHDIISTVENMTKDSLFITDAASIPRLLEMAISSATCGRPGPVWIDIPADLQTAEIPEASLFPMSEPAKVRSFTLQELDDIHRAIAIMKNSTRPVVLAGQGIKQSRTVSEFVQFIEQQDWPYVSTYGARDLLPYHHPLNIGAIGIKGSRAGNFVMQCSDALLVLGCSVNTSHIGYDTSSWTPLARRILVDTDHNERGKMTVGWHHQVACDLGDFFRIAGDINANR